MNRPTSLLVVSTSLDTGGAQRFVSTLLTHLDRDRVRPELALLRNEVGYGLPEGTRVHPLGYGGPQHLPRTISRLCETIRRREPDVVLSNTTATNLVAGFAVSHGAAWPRWIARIGTNPSRHDSFLRRVAARYVYRRAETIIANSQGLAGEVRRQFPRLAGRVAVIGNPTDFAALDQQAALPPACVRTSDRTLLIAVGRLFREKRYDVMLDALAIIRKQVDAELWICGEGPERLRLERQIRELSLSDSVLLLGFCRNPHALLRQADLFLMTSDHEGSPNSLIEAQGLGVPAVATRCSHGPEEIIVEGKTGLLTPVGDVKAFADAALDALQSKNLFSCTAADEQVRQRFDARRLVQQWEDMLSSHVEPTSSEDENVPRVLQGQSQ